jgi:multiple sugar transport system permease protein
MRMNVEREVLSEVAPAAREPALVAQAQRRPRGPRLDEEARAGLVFISPFLFGFVVFTAGPLLASLYLSFTSYDVLSPPRWIGFSNYQRMFSDVRFAKTLLNTLYFTLMHVPTAIPIALGLALLLNARVRGLSFWRTAFYLPQITPAVAAGVLWLRILSPQNGLLNEALALVGIAGPNWTIDAQWVKPALVIMKSWSLGWMVIVYLAALKQVPKDLYEAAIVDGANVLERFWYVTLPMISSVLFFTLVMLTIFSLNVFTEPMVMFPPQVFGGQMGPQDSALFYVLYLFDQAFGKFRMGYASALAWVLFLVSILIVTIQTRGAKRFVYTESGKV